MKGFSTVRLIIVLGLLVGVYMLISLSSNTGRSKSYRDQLVSINSGNVSAIKITSPEETVSLSKEGEDWFVELAGGNKVKTKENSISGFLSTLETIEPGAIATRKPEKWGDYQTDSTGMRVEVMEGNEKTLDLVVGRFNMTGQRSYSTYVRLSEDDEVYSADNFMGIGLGKTTASFRENVLFKVNKDSITQISFNYPDSAFALGKVDGQWVLDGERADSASVMSYISGLSYLSSNQFSDEVDFQFPQLSVSIQTPGKEYKIEAMAMDSTFVIHTDENMDGYFVDDKLFSKLFKGQSEFRK